jgi:hypothetical protein
MDANLLHISYEGGILEDPWAEAEEDMWRWSVSPEQAPEKATYLELTYEQGDIVALDGKAMTPAEVLTELNRVGGAMLLPIREQSKEGKHERLIVRNSHGRPPQAVLALSNGMRMSCAQLPCHSIAGLWRV